jgi:hypothetical protein
MTAFRNCVSPLDILQPPCNLQVQRKTPVPRQKMHPFERTYTHRAVTSALVARRVAHSLTRSMQDAFKACATHKKTATPSGGKQQRDNSRRHERRLIFARSLQKDPHFAIQLPPQFLKGWSLYISRKGSPHTLMSGHRKNGVGSLFLSAPEASWGVAGLFYVYVYSI